MLRKLGFINDCIYVDCTQTEIDDLKLMSFVGIISLQTALSAGRENS